MNIPTWKRFSSSTPMLVQGMTGKEGARMTKWLLQSGMQVCAGVTPGKGGTRIEGCPIFHSVKEACSVFPQIEVTSIVVPAARVREAVMEALDAGIKYLHILTESVPAHDVLAIKAEAFARQAVILGPSSVGYLQFPPWRLGYIGGENPFDVVKEGNIALISTSGGMLNELMMGMSRQGFGIRLALAVGGDRVPLFSLEQALSFGDAQTDVSYLVLFVEPGRSFLRELLQGRRVFRHPLIVFLAGDILDDLPRGKAYGHTGTLLQEEEMSVTTLREMLKERGIPCMATMSELFTYFEALCQKR